MQRVCIFARNNIVAMVAESTPPETATKTTFDPTSSLNLATVSSIVPYGLKLIILSMIGRVYIPDYYIISQQKDKPSYTTFPRLDIQRHLNYGKAFCRFLFLLPINFCKLSCQGRIRTCGIHVNSVALYHSTTRQKNSPRLWESLFNLEKTKLTRNTVCYYCCCCK